jgi:hypothetical protein
MATAGACGHIQCGHIYDILDRMPSLRSLLGQLSKTAGGTIDKAYFDALSEYKSARVRVWVSSSGQASISY